MAFIKISFLFQRAIHSPCLVSIPKVHWRSFRIKGDHFGLRIISWSISGSVQSWGSLQRAYTVVLDIEGTWNKIRLYLLLNRTVQCVFYSSPTTGGRCLFIDWHYLAAPDYMSAFSLVILTLFFVCVGACVHVCDFSALNLRVCSTTLCKSLLTYNVSSACG